MAGHSKWANIKHRKAGVDKKRGLVFSKLSKELMVASRLGGTDSDTNNRLRVAITKARGANMPRDTIERAVKKGAGELGDQDFEEFLYEVYATGGIGMIVDGLSDNMARTTPEIKSTIKKNGARLAEINAVRRLFRYCGFISIENTKISEEELMEVALEAGAEDIRADGDFYEVITPIEDFATVSEALNDKEIEVSESGLRYLPLEGTEVTVKNAEHARKILKLVDLLEENDDVQSVYVNMHIPDEFLQDMEQD